MEKTFWHQRWENNEIAFHERGGNRLLMKYLHRLDLAAGARLFIPLCGKTLDIAWLPASGYRVAGAELSEIAVRQLFEALEIKPAISTTGRLKRYSAENMDIFLGDIFDLSGGLLGRVDAVYDRAALVAFPQDMRGRYAAHVMNMTAKAPQLLICYEYDQDALAGPPFSVSAGEVRRHYAKAYDASLLESAEISGGLKGKCPARETIWLLKPVSFYI